MANLPSTSIISTAALQRWYDYSLTETEADTTAFWHAVFNQHFPAERYLLVPQAPPDSSQERADAALYRLMDDGRKAVMLWFEAQHAFDVARVVEDQVLIVARLYFKALPEHDTTAAVFAMSVIGPTFRLWRVLKNQGTLVPLHGDDQRNDKSQYLDAKTEAASAAFFSMASLIMAEDH